MVLKIKGAKLKKIICLFVVFLTMFHFSIINCFAYDGRVIEESEVSKVNLHMYYDFGKFSGYLIFYDKQANECAVNIIPKGLPRLMIEHSLGTTTKWLQITPNDFQVMKLRNGDEHYGFPINFLPTFEIRKRGKIQFRFSSSFLTSTTETEIGE